jgi:glycosyltransferase involved in cell wall biosynthesis
MAYGVAPLVTRVSGAADLVEHERTGVVLAGSDVSAILSALEQADALDAEQWRAMSLAARDRIAAHYSIDLIAENYLQLYQRLRDRERTEAVAPIAMAAAPMIDRVARRDEGVR